MGLAENELRKHRCCFTGHRPEKLECNIDDLMLKLEDEIDRAILMGHRTFISGMARGVDLWAAEIIIRKKRENDKIHLISAIPFPEFDTNWERCWQQKSRHILMEADYVKTVSPSYSTHCFQKRNEWMVDHSALIIAAYEGRSGGTHNTLAYATQKKIQIRNVLR